MMTFTLKSMCAVVLGAISMSVMADISIDSVSFATTTAAKPVATNVVQNWMHSDVGTAWGQGYKGQGTTITVVDDFTSASKFAGNLGTGTLTQRHGEWTRLEASMIAPSATIKNIDYNASSTKYVPTAGRLNVVNASYGLMAPSGYKVAQINFGTLQNSIIAAAKAGTAVIVKSAGNSAVAVNGVKNGQADYMNLALMGSASVLYVGSLEKHGSTTAKAKLASYSNFAGSDASIQNRFLVVGVDVSKTGLAGTSFASPEISGYVSILGSKFTKATAVQVSNQLLNTARTDTIANYSKAVHGRGEASLSRALAPTTIK